jgi:hypothetical protein
MSPALIELVFFTEVHQKLARLLERQLEVDEVGDELAHCVENDVLCQYFRDPHRWGLFLHRIGSLGVTFSLILIVGPSSKQTALDLASQASA